MRDWQTASFEWRLLGGSLQSGDDFEFNIQRFMDAPADTFEVFRDVVVAPGRYWWTRGELQYSTSAARPLSVGAQVSAGDFYGGRSTDVSLDGTWRGGGHVILGADATWTEARVPAGRFQATEAAGRIEYAFTTRSTFMAFMQYNNEDRRADFNLRLHWIPTIGDDVFVVWNTGYSTDRAGKYAFPSTRALPHPLNGALVIKVAHRFARQK